MIQGSLEMLLRPWNEVGFSPAHTLARALRPSERSSALTELPWEHFTVLAWEVRLMDQVDI